MESDEAFNKIFLPFVDKTKYLTLKVTSRVEDFKNEELRDVLSKAYAYRDIEHRFLATLVNCVFTQNSKTFIMTTRGFVNLMKDDPNGNGKGIDYSTYGVQKRKLHDLGYIKTLRKPLGQKSGVYQLSLPYLVEMLKRQCSEDYFKTQERAVLDFYDRQDKIDKKTQGEATEKYNQMKRDLGAVVE